MLQRLEHPQRRKASKTRSRSWLFAAFPAAPVGAFLTAFGALAGCSCVRVVLFAINRVSEPSILPQELNPCWRRTLKLVPGWIFPLFHLMQRKPLSLQGGRALNFGYTPWAHSFIT